MMIPRDEKDVADVIASADGPLSVQGGNTRGMSGPGAPLSVAGLNEISLYEPGALTLVAQAGTPVADIVAALAADNQRLAFEPMDHRGLLQTTGVPTIGGVIAANVSGPRRISVGAARDFALGVRFVDGTGTIVKNGGRVMKNVTGYDLVKLMSGSFGSLGVLTEVALKVLPMPETETTLVLHGLSDALAVAAMSRALGSPYEVTGVAHDPAQLRTFLRVEGFADSVTYRISSLKEILEAPEMSILAASESVPLWAGIRDVSVFNGSDDDVWRVSCKPTDGPILAEKVGADGVFYDWGGGLLWLRVPQGTQLRDRLRGFAGHATRVRGRGDAVSRLHPEPAGVARLTEGLRARFDPRHILNSRPFVQAG